MITRSRVALLSAVNSFVSEPFVYGTLHKTSREAALIKRSRKAAPDVYNVAGKREMKLPWVSACIL